MFGRRESYLEGSHSNFLVLRSPAAACNLGVSLCHRSSRGRATVPVPFLCPCRIHDDGPQDVLSTHVQSKIFVVCLKLVVQKVWNIICALLQVCSTG
jgi:hypothetical protein